MRLASRDTEETKSFVSISEHSHGKEVTDQDLEDLHYQHSFNSRLILQAISRKLRFIREDRCLPLGASTSSVTPIHELALLHQLDEEQAVLDQITDCYYNVDRTKRYKPEYYVGFWDAWTSIRDIGNLRLVEERYLRSIDMIENARLDLYFPDRHETQFDNDEHNSKRGLISINSNNYPNFQHSYSQTELYTPHTSTSRRCLLQSISTDQHHQNKVQEMWNPTRTNAQFHNSKENGHVRYQPKQQRSCTELVLDREDPEYPDQDANRWVSRPLVRLDHNVSQTCFSITSSTLSKDGSSFACRGLSSTQSRGRDGLFSPRRKTPRLELDRRLRSRHISREIGKALTNSSCQSRLDSIDDTCDSIIDMYCRQTRRSVPATRLSKSLVYASKTPFSDSDVGETLLQFKRSMRSSVNEAQQLLNTPIVPANPKSSKLRRIIPSGLFDPVK